MIEPAQDKWYREKFVWMIIFFPFAAVVGGIITVILALKSDDGLVVDDYYKQGLEINRTLDRDETATDNRLQAKLQLPDAPGPFRIQLTARPEFREPDKLSARFLHATRSGHDHQLTMERTGPNLYESQLPVLISGKWYILIEADDWRLLEIITRP